MKKAIPGLLCLLLITTCGFEMPESITIKGRPGLYVPLGSPFAGMKEEDKLENLISPDNIKKMLNDTAIDAGSDSNLTIYEVGEDLKNPLGIQPKVQTYLARYHLADMPLDLKKYADAAMGKVEGQFTIPDTPPKPAGVDYVYLIDHDPWYELTDNNKPFVKIPLDEMAKLVKWAKKSGEGGSIFGLEFNYSKELEDDLELRIPGFDIEDNKPYSSWVKGIPTDEKGNQTSVNPTKLRFFYPNKEIFYPRAQLGDDNTQISSDLEGKELLIYARISAPFSEQTLNPKLIFSWYEALIDTTTPNEVSQDGSFKREYPITNSLSEFLGNGVSFKRVDGYMYMSGVHVNNSYISVGIHDNSNDEELMPAEPHFLKEVDPPKYPNGEKFNLTDGDILLDPDKMSFIEEKPLDLKQILEASNATLRVSITIEDMKVYQSELEQSGAAEAIQIDLLVLIPMDLKVQNEIKDSAVNQKIRDEYVMLDLDVLKTDIDPDSEKGDLFGRKEGEKNYLQDIEYVDITIKYSKDDINIIEPSKLAVLVSTKNGSELLLFKDNDASLTLRGEFLNKIPFNPEFTILLKKDEVENTSPVLYKDFGSFIITHQDKPSFDFKLYVAAQVKLEYTFEL